MTEGETEHRVTREAHGNVRGPTMAQIASTYRDMTRIWRVIEGTIGQGEGTRDKIFMEREV